MKRLIAIAVVGVGLAGCGGSGTNAASVKCNQWRADAQSWAQNYVSDLPSQPSPATIQQLATATYKATAASHGWNCP